MICRQKQLENFSDNVKPGIATSALFRWIAMAASIIIIFFMTPFIIGHLGKEGYGIWVILTSLVGYYGLLNLGITSAVTRYIAVYVGEKNLLGLNTTFNTAFFSFIFIGITAVILSILLGPSLAKAFTINNIEEFKNVVIIMGIAVGIGFPTSVIISTLIAHEQHKAQSVIALLSSIIRALLTIFFLQNNYGLTGIAFAFLAVASFELFAFSITLITKFKWIHFQLKLFKLSMLKTMLVFGLPTLIMTVSALMRTNLDNIVIGSIIGLEEVAVYSVAALIISHIFNFANTGLGVFTSRFSRKTGAQKDIRPLFKTSLFYSSLLATTAGLGIYLFGETFLKLWLGEGFNDSAQILIILVTGYVIAISQIPGYTVLMSLNKHKIFSIFTFFEGIMNVGLSIILAKHFGIVGVAFGTIIPMLFIKILIQPYFVSKALEIPISSYLTPLIIPTISSTAFLLTSTALEIKDQLLAFGWVQLIVSAFILVTLYLSATITFTRVKNKDLLKLNH